MFHVTPYFISKTSELCDQYPKTGEGTDDNIRDAVGEDQVEMAVVERWTLEDGSYY